ncbi:hypothetical protein KBB96_06155 [Luteolibacter ambystomatis]|uniref:Uncharacterized protein n=1 Tax=Luteolibacter ambystomatis TaxID=2824561 RepID=A0A975J1U4_9BACT|nr:hypothetical protein [Luteolibacter ambystomatis]QUE52473.1 hypothetical protein KBB96_06155 [Luteolibacter ambystomatis]
MPLLEELDARLPVTVVMAAALDLLDHCGWKMEFDGLEVMTVPRRPAPLLVSRAFVREEFEGFAFGDHFEAGIALDPLITPEGLQARAGFLKLYFDLEGQMIGEDRFPPMED